MNWSNISILAQRCFFCAATAAVAGSALVIILLLLERIPRWKNSRLHLVWIKMAQILYLFPIAAVSVVGSRIDFSFGFADHISTFWTVTTSLMQKIYGIITGIWLTGMLIGIFFRIAQYCKLKRILRGNIPVTDDMCRNLIQKYKKNYKLKQVEVYQNDFVCCPISVGIFRPRVILPLKNYKEKELHMILGHEMNHIRKCDLFWKKSGLLVTFIHWWNPLAYILLYKLILREEIDCDIKTCEDSTDFTMKEYGLYLSGMDENQNNMVFSSALCKSNKDIFRRLEGMVKGEKYKKWTAVISCLILSFLATVPSYAASEGMARLNEAWIAETEVATEESAIDFEKLEKTEYAALDEGIEEIDLTLEDGIAPLSVAITLDNTISPNTRLLYSWQEMQEGDKVFVSANCSNGNIVYRIGIRDYSGHLTYVEGSGSLDHIFTIASDGKYTVYVENRSDTSMKVTGSASYIN